MTSIQVPQPTMKQVGWVKKVWRWLLGREGILIANTGSQLWVAAVLALSYLNPELIESVVVQIMIEADFRAPSWLLVDEEKYGMKGRTIINLRQMYFQAKYSTRQCSITYKLVVWVKLEAKRRNIFVILVSSINLWMWKMMTNIVKKQVMTNIFKMRVMPNIVKLLIIAKNVKIVNLVKIVNIV